MAREQVINDWVLKLGLDVSEVVKGEKRVEGILRKLERIESKNANIRNVASVNALSAEKRITTEKQKQDQLTIRRIRAQTAIQAIERRAGSGGLKEEQLGRIRDNSKSLQASLREMSSGKDFAFLSRRINKFSSETNDLIKKGNVELAKRNSLTETQARINDRLESISRRARMGSLSQDQQSVIGTRVDSIRSQMVGADREGLRSLARDTRFVNEETSRYISLARRQREAMTASMFAARGFSTSLKNLAGGFASVFAVFAIGRSMYNVAEQLDSIKASFLAASGNAVQAAEDFQYVVNISKELGVSLTEAASGYRQIGASARQIGFDVSQSRDFFLAATEASRAFGLSADRTQLVYLAFSQILSKGKVSQEELRRQMGEQLPGVMNIAAKAMNVTTSELEEMIKTGISAEEFMPKFSAELRKAAREGGALEASINSITAARQRMMASWQDSITEASDKGFRTGIVDFFNSISGLIDQLKPLIREIGKFIGSLLTGISEVIDLFSALIGIVNIVDEALMGATEVDLSKARSELNIMQQSAYQLRINWLYIIGYIEYGIGLLQEWSRHKMTIGEGVKSLLGFESENSRSFSDLINKSVSRGKEKANFPSQESLKNIQVNNTNNFHGSPEQNAKLMDNMFQNYLTIE